MILEILNHTYQYEALKLAQIFYPNEKIEVVTEKSSNTNNDVVLSTLFDENDVIVSFKSDELNIKKSKNRKSMADEELIMTTLMFDILKDVTNYTPQWGVLTGIRPSKLLRTLQNEMGEEKALKYFTDNFFVTKEKTNLTKSVAMAEEKIIRLSKPMSFSLYVSIPFCPTRCSYCSFVSHSMTSKTAKDLVPEYVKLLCEEIRHTGKIAKELNLHLESIYFGGGTPTTLEASELTQLINAISESFDLSDLLEYTVEAGRPDTITEEKLLALKEGNVTRISINPQSFNDDVLKEIGRNHSADLAVEKFRLARKMGFNNINMDLIAGLPRDNLASFKNSLLQTSELNPENITVHTLALKRSSNLGRNKVAVETEKSDIASKMLSFTYETLINKNYFPYYMYRQSRTIGNLENTGYSKKGFEGVYNIFMMEECHTVLAVGAGAVTKLKEPNTKYIERIFNFKYPYEYIRDFSEIINRKSVIIPFYDKSNNDK
ncbi:MAG: coproporphyrinogen dehydrogenase HemZ [Oscillospiraceae bacterium]